MPEPTSVSDLLVRWQSGDAASLEALTRRLYAELRRIAAGYLRRERAGHTLQPTALVAEAYVRLCGEDAAPLENRRHFVAIAARHMRQILVDHARKRRAAKRGAGVRVTLDESVMGDAPGRDMTDLDDALHELEALDPRKVRILELLYFGGMTQPEIAATLELHVNTVARDTRLAQAWLKKRLSR